VSSDYRCCGYKRVYRRRTKHPIFVFLLLSLSLSRNRIMKIVTSIAFGAFFAAAGIDAFGSVQPLNGAVSNGSEMLASMRYNIGDKRRHSRIVNVIDSKPTKEVVQSQLLNDKTSEQLKECNWKVRKTLMRKIGEEAQKHDLTIPEGFGIPLTQSEREAKEILDGAKRKAERIATRKDESDALAKAKKELNEKRAARKIRAAIALEARKAKYPSKKHQPLQQLAEDEAEEEAEIVTEIEVAANGEIPAAPASDSANSSSNEVTPKTIKQLRDATGAGMMDCKRALLECDGDQETAAEFLRKKGLAKADKKASRVAAEGKIAVGKSSNNKAVMVEVNCETDFVGKDSTFLSYCDKVADTAASLLDNSDTASVDELMSTEVDGESLETTRQGLVSKIGENIQVRRLESRGGGDGKTVGGYVHMNSIGVLVELEGGDEQLCTDIAMHVTAMNPPFATPDDVPADVLEKERRILTEQALDSGKPESIVEKMVDGRIRKYLEEKCLVSQPYVRDGGMTVQQLLDKNDAKMIGFTRLVVGEGIEKKEDDFAAEVAAMAGGR